MRSYLERPLDLAVNPMAICREDRTDAFLAHGPTKVQGNAGQTAGIRAFRRRITRIIGLCGERMAATFSVGQPFQADGDRRMSRWKA